jgi:peptidyl-tRNA hydrolase, PTH1 family
MKLVVGLGNPGDKYTATRHNAGFWLVERLAAQNGTVLRKDGKFQALIGRHEASGAWLMLPQSYMNSSGRPVQMMASFFKISTSDILVIHDELDLPPGVARLKQGGGVAGHNGLKDISARLGSHDYWRLRIGIGRPPDRQSGADFVLNRPAPDERAAIDAAIERSLEVIPLVLAGDLQGAMLKLHSQAPNAPAGPAKQPDRESKSMPLHESASQGPERGPQRIETEEGSRTTLPLGGAIPAHSDNRESIDKDDPRDGVEKYDGIERQKTAGSKQGDGSKNVETEGALKAVLKHLLPRARTERKK